MVRLTGAMRRTGAMGALAFGVCASCASRNAAQTNATAPSWTEPAADAPVFGDGVGLLGVNGAVHLPSMRPVSRDDIGALVEVVGYARLQDGGRPVVVRSQPLVVCEGVGGWPQDALARQWVVARGTLTRNECASARAMECPPYALKDCSVSWGVRDEDVAPGDMASLRAVVADAELGERMVMAGELRLWDVRQRLDVSGQWVWLDGCEGSVGSVVTVSGILDYEPAWVLIPAPLELVQVSGILGNGFFVLRECRIAR